jgi:predicted enzyme related to lactoylglutathione lyase
MFVWRELMTDDVDGARRFYGELLGWTWTKDDAGGGHAYWIAARGGKDVCGLMGKPPGVPMPSAWSSYVLAEDVDAAASRCATAGGRVLREPSDIPGVGRFAVIADPWGAVLFPFRPSSGETAPPAMPPAPGTFCWESLVTADPAAAIAFYGKVLGWGTAPTPGGDGKVFTAGEAQVADIQAARPGGPSYWATYVAVEGAEATRDRAVRLGAKVIVPRLDVPKVGVVSFVADPAGATLGLFEPGRPP